MILITIRMSPSMTNQYPTHETSNICIWSNLIHMTNGHTSGPLKRIYALLFIIRPPGKQFYQSQVRQLLNPKQKLTATGVTVYSCPKAHHH